MILGQTVTGPFQAFTNALFEDALVETFTMAIIVSMFEVIGQRRLTQVSPLQSGMIKSCDQLVILESPADKILVQSVYCD